MNFELPFTEEKKDDFYIRIFSSDVSEEELMWHRDKEARIIEPLEPTSWMIQLDNELPVYISEKIYIPKEVYHRLLKGDNDLKIKIYKI